MSDFGDFDDDDAFDTEPFDPEQVAMRLVKYRKDDEPMLPSWEQLDRNERAREIEIIVRLFAWLRRQGAFR